MNCKCIENSHGHSGICNAEITFRDSSPINYYKIEKKYGKDDSGNRIVMGKDIVDADKEKCCDDCYDKTKHEAISALKIYKNIDKEMNKEIKEHPLGTGFAQKDMKVMMGCELCGEHVESKRRSDGIYVCNVCNSKHNIGVNNE